MTIWRKYRIAFPVLCCYKRKWLGVLSQGHDINVGGAGLASVVTPFHSATDGDVLFGASTGTAGPATREGRPGETADLLGALAAQLLARATLGAVRIANAER